MPLYRTVPVGDTGDVRLERIDQPRYDQETNLLFRRPMPPITSVTNSPWQKLINYLRWTWQGKISIVRSNLSQHYFWWRSRRRRWSVTFERVNP